MNVWVLSFCLVAGVSTGYLAYRFPSPWWLVFDAVGLLFCLWFYSRQWRERRRLQSSRSHLIMATDMDESIKAAMRTLIDHPTLPVCADQMVWLQGWLEDRYPVNPYLTENARAVLQIYWIALLRRHWEAVSLEYDAERCERLLRLAPQVWPLAWAPSAWLPDQKAYTIGNPHCFYNAHESKLRCAVHPTASTCDGCRDYKPSA